MSGALHERWAALGERERRWLVAGAVGVLLVLAWDRIWDPLASAWAALRAEAVRNEQALAWMRPAARALASGGHAESRPAAANGRSLLARFDAGAREAGLAGGLVGVEPLGGDRVRARFAAVAFDGLIAWLEAEAGRGLRVEELSLRRAGGAGLVDGQLVLQTDRP